MPDRMDPHAITTEWRDATTFTPAEIEDARNNPRPGDTWRIDSRIVRSYRVCDVCPIRLLAFAVFSGVGRAETSGPLTSEAFIQAVSNATLVRRGA